jgi:hypothetical protein
MSTRRIVCLCMPCQVRLKKEAKGVRTVFVCAHVSNMHWASGSPSSQLWTNTILSSEGGIETSFERTLIWFRKVVSACFVHSEQIHFIGLHACKLTFHQLIYIGCFESLTKLCASAKFAGGCTRREARLFVRVSLLRVDCHSEGPRAREQEVGLGIKLPIFARQMGCVGWSSVEVHVELNEERMRSIGRTSSARSRAGIPTLTFLVSRPHLAHDELAAEPTLRFRKRCLYKLVHYYMLFLITAS